MRNSCFHCKKFSVVTNDVVSEGVEKPDRNMTMADAFQHLQLYFVCFNLGFKNNTIQIIESNNNNTCSFMCSLTGLLDQDSVETKRWGATAPKGPEKRRALTLSQGGEKRGALTLSYVRYIGRALPLSGGDAQGRDVGSQCCSTMMRTQGEVLPDTVYTKGVSALA